MEGSRPEWNGTRIKGWMNGSRKREREVGGGMEERQGGKER